MKKKIKIQLIMLFGLFSLFVISCTTDPEIVKPDSINDCDPQFDLLQKRYNECNSEYNNKLFASCLIYSSQFSELG